MNKLIILGFLMLLCGTQSYAQPVLSTGGKTMPNEWIDSSTGHLVKRLTNLNGNYASFYFHNNPFLPAANGKGWLMVFYGNDQYNGDGRGRQLHVLNLQTGKSEQLTFSSASKFGEIVAVKRREAFYQSADSVFAVHIDTKKVRLVYVFPAAFKGSITTINADETMLAGALSSEEEKAILKQYPSKSEFFNRIYEAKLERVLFSIDINKGSLQEIYREHAWLNHVQFSPNDPQLLMYCHEGPWHKVDRIWTINLKTGIKKLMHERTMPMEITGHEWFAADGQKIWYDLQQPRGETFFVGAANVYNTGHEKYRIQRNEWSVHFNSNKNQTLFAGDGGNPGQVAKAPDGQWIYTFRPSGDSIQATKLVSMKHHQYRFEPNVHISPDEKWIIFRANFEGKEQIYAAAIAASKERN